MACDLRDRGVSFDEDELARMELDCSGLSLMQNCDLPSTAFAVPGGAGYVFNAAILNESRSIFLAPSFIRFECPTWEIEICLLQDPKKKTPRENLYSFSRARRYEFQREIVLNPLIGRRQTLAPGEVIEGYLLAVGRMAIPPQYRQHDRFDVRVALFDQWGRSDQQIFHLSVEREAEDKRTSERIATARQSRGNITTAA